MGYQADCPVAQSINASDSQRQCGDRPDSPTDTLPNSSIQTHGVGQIFGEPTKLTDSGLFLEAVASFTEAVLDSLVRAQ